MKVILTTGQYTFTPASNQIVFNLGGSFKPENLYAVIDTTTGKLVYSASGTNSGFGGSFSTTTFTNDTLTYTSSNVGQAPTDILQCIYEDPTANQNISGSVSTTGSANVFDGSGNSIGSTLEPISGRYRLWTENNTQAGDGTPILSTYDALSGEDGLNVNLLNSSFGGQIGSAIPIPNNNNALSVGFLNGSTLVAPAMDPVTNELKVQGTFSPPALQNVDLQSVDGAPIALGQTNMAQSLPVTIAGNQTAIPITATTPINVNVAQSVSQDILGVAIGGNRNNQIEVAFNTAPGASLITNTFTGAGSVSITNGHSVYQTGSVAAAASAQAVSVQTTTYRPAHEIYAAFTAAFLNMAPARSDAKIGLFDANNGFFIGFNISLSFCVGVRNAGVDTFIPQGSWNTDELTGGSTSKFTRNGVPEALNFAFSNLFRIRFAWLGSANIYFEVFSPDGEWVLFHNIRQPNSNFNPSIQNPNLPMTVVVSKTTGSTNSQVATACWGAGTTSAYSPITATLTDNTLAAMTRSVITGVTTGGGGGYVNVKVNPSGALVTDSTVSSSVLPTGAATSANQTNGTQLTRVTDGTNTAAIKAASTAPLATDPSLVVTVSPNSPTLPTSTNINQYGGAAVSLGQKVMTASIPVVVSSDQSTINTALPDLYITGQAGQTATINNIIPATASASATDALGYRSGYIQIVASAGITSGQLTVECTNDSPTSSSFQIMPIFTQSLITGTPVNTAFNVTANTQFIYGFPITARYIRVRISTAIGGGGTVQAFTRLSQTPFTALVQTVAQPTAANLNTNVSGSVTVSGSLTSAGTVTQATAANLNCTALVAGATIAASTTTDINAASVTATGVSATITPTNAQSAAFALVVTVTSGSGTLDVTLQEALDGTASPTLWENIYQFERITTAQRIYIPAMRLSGTNIRLNYTVTGTVNYSVTLLRTTRQVSAPMVRRLLDRSIVLTTLNSTTAALWVDGCESFDLIASLGAGGSAPVLQLQGSEDGTNWYNIGTGLTATISATTTLGVTDGSLPKWIRAQATTAGSAGTTLNYIALKGKSAG